jgi:hypothetical protein
MKNMAKIRTGFSAYADAALLVKASYIVTSMTDNPNFVNPVPPLANVASRSFPLRDWCRY